MVRLWHSGTGNGLVENLSRSKCFQMTQKNLPRILVNSKETASSEFNAFFRFHLYFIGIEKSFEAQPVRSLPPVLGTAASAVSLDRHRALPAVADSSPTASMTCAVSLWGFAYSSRLRQVQRTADGIVFELYIADLVSELVYTVCCNYGISIRSNCILRFQVQSTPRASDQKSRSHQAQWSAKHLLLLRLCREESLAFRLRVQVWSLESWVGICHTLQASRLSRLMLNTRISHENKYIKYI